jgi:hypothetical protein
MTAWLLHMTEPVAVVSVAVAPFVKVAVMFGKTPASTAEAEAAAAFCSLADFCLGTVIIRHPVSGSWVARGEGADTQADARH